MYNLINDSDRNNMIIRSVDSDNHKTCSKDTIRSIKSTINWGFLRSVNGALPNWNALPMDMEKLPFNSFRISLLGRFKF